MLLRGMCSTDQALGSSMLYMGCIGTVAALLLQARRLALQMHGVTMGKPCACSSSPQATSGLCRG